MGRPRGAPGGLSSAYSVGQTDPRRQQAIYDEQTEALFMQANNAQLEAMEHKVSALRNITTEIRTEAKAQNDLLTRLEDDFGSAGVMLSGTLKRLQGMFETGGSNHMCYLIAFIFSLFMFIYFVFRK